MNREALRILVPWNLGEEHLARIKATLPSAVLMWAPKEDEKELRPLLGEAEVVLGVRLTPKTFAWAKRLKWIQLMSAGADRHLYPEMVESQVIMTNMSGAHAISIPEHVLSMIFTFTRRLPHWQDAQQERKWALREDDKFDELSGRTIGVMGLGSIGGELARKAKALGMRVVATKRRIVLCPDYVDELVPREERHRLIRAADFLVITCPLTRETEGLIGEAELRLMKSSAYLINPARGKIVDEAALICALKEGWIAGAALDVFAQEPLPSSSELWELENVIITPHIAGGSPHLAERKIAIFCENLLRYTSGQPLINVVDKRLGY